MLQIDVCPYASDALEDAMRLAQTKALNSYTFSDCLNFLNYVWSDIYNQICMIDSGYYSKTVKLTEKLTKLPRYVKNSIRVYSAQRPVGFDRRDYRQSGDADLTAPYTYQISGTDLWCPDALSKTVWFEYCPQPAQIFFTHHNRDPKIYPDGHDTEMDNNFNLYKLIGSYKTLYEQEIVIDDFSNPNLDASDIAKCTKWVMRHKNPRLGIADEDITEYILKESDPENGNWVLKYITCDYPYIFCSYQNDITGEWRSGFLNKDYEWTNYNPFAFTGKPSNIEYLSCKYNDKTGMGVIVRDWNDIDEKLINIEHLPEQINSIIYIENGFEYKATDGVVYKFERGFYYNRFATDFNYEKVTDYDENITPDIGDVASFNNVLKRFNGEEWVIVADSISHFAIKESSPVVKELGWTPDTKLVYPAPEVYRYLVARLAEKFAALNESNIMGVQSELTDAQFAFQAFLKKDKSAWERMRNVNPATITDWL